MHGKPLLVLLAVLVLGVGCGASLKRHGGDVRYGDSEERVREILGEPESISFNGPEARWSYCDGGVGRMIYVRDGAVVRSEGYGRRGSTCVRSKRQWRRQHPGEAL